MRIYDSRHVDRYARGSQTFGATHTSFLIVVERLGVNLLGPYRLAFVGAGFLRTESFVLGREWWVRLPPSASNYVVYQHYFGRGKRGCVWGTFIALI